MSTLFPPSLETERLRLEQLCYENVPLAEFHETVGAEEMESVTEYLFWDRPRTLKDSRSLLENEIEHWEEGTKASYVVRPTGGDDLAPEERMAFAGVAKLFVDWDRRTGEVGVWLRPQFQGRGYADERLEPLLELAFHHLDLPMVEANVTDGNERSREGVENYVERYGGRYEGLLRRSATAGYYETDVVDQHRFTIAREEYEAARD